MHVNKDVESILKERYLLRNSEGELVESPEEMVERVSSHVASAEPTQEKQEEWMERFEQVLNNLDFLPNSPTLMNAGTEIGQMSACFVLDVDDDLESIYDSLSSASKIFKSGGGVGFSFSRLREEGALIKSTGGTSSGPVSFMKNYDSMAQTVKQGGKRRGAMMGSLSIHHPDIEDFITAKVEEGKLSNFNISVEVTEEFMTALRNNDTYEIRSPLGGDPNDPSNERVVEERSADEVMRLLAEASHDSAEPGVMFIDRMNEEYPFDAEPGDKHYIRTTNPCGEEPLESHDACNLGHINLSQCVTSEGEIDWDKLNRLVKTGLRFLDNVVTKGEFPVPSIREKVSMNRRIGLGVMGWHEMLLKLRIPYDSQKTVELGEKLSTHIYNEANKYSQELAEEKGAFPEFDNSTLETPRRNATLMTVAPTGTTSMIAGTIGGIEPVPRLISKKIVMDDETVETTNETVKELIENGHEPHEGLLKESMDIGYEWHIKHQQAWQEGVDASISKTISMPRDVSVSDVYDAYVTSWEQGCKGLTIYRDGSKEGAPIQDASEDEEEDSSSEGPVEVPPERFDGRHPKDRGKVTSGETEKMKVGCDKSLYVTCNSEEGEMVEVFNSLGKSGGCLESFIEGQARLISLALRGGIDPEEIIDQLSAIRCPSPAGFGENKLLSCSDATAEAMKNYLERAREGTDEKVEVTTIDKIRGQSPECSDCGMELVYTEGCLKCTNPSCGYSKC